MCQESTISQEGKWNNEGKTGPCPRKIVRKDKQETREKLKGTKYVKAVNKKHFADWKKKHMKGRKTTVFKAFTSGKRGIRTETECNESTKTNTHIVSFCCPHGWKVLSMQYILTH